MFAVPNLVDNRFTRVIEIM